VVGVRGQAGGRVIFVVLRKKNDFVPRLIGETVLVSTVTEYKQKDPNVLKMSAMVYDQYISSKYLLKSCSLWN
jgi:hypothetical protein